MQTRKAGSTLIVLLLLAGIAAALSLLFVASIEFDTEKKALTSLVSGVAVDMHSHFANDLTALVGLKAFWLGSQNVTKDEFATYAATIYPQVPEFTSIEWVDVGNVVRYVYPLEGENLKAVDLDENLYPNRIKPLLAAKEARLPTVSAPVVLVQGFPGIIVFVPIFRNDAYLGAVVGVIKLQTLLGETAGLADQSKYDLVLQAGDRLLSKDAGAIYTTKGERVIDPTGKTVPDPSALTIDTKAAVAQVRLGDQSWSLHLRQRQNTVSPFSLVTTLGVLFIAIDFLLLYLLRKNQRSLEEASQRERDFVALVSHQLRIPLTELSWMIDSVFETSSGMTEEQSTTVQEIRSIIRGSIKLVSDLLNVSRIDRGVLEMRCEEVLIAELIGETIKPLVRMADERGVKFVVSVPEKLTAYVDSQKAIEALRNIIDNALKYGPGNSNIEIGAKEADGYATISIRDHGAGIAREIQPKLFDKASAFSKKGTRDGAGLGLYLTKEFIELMGGEVKFETSAKGTVFLVSLSQEKTAACLDKEVSQ